MEAAALQKLLQEVVTARAPGSGARILAARREHPQVRGLVAPVVLPDDPESPLTLHAGSFSALEDAEAGFDAVALVDRTLELSALRREEDEATAEAMPYDKSLFEAHADFLRDRPVPVGWYRRGASLGDGLFAVDLDVFQEVVLRGSEWAGLRGGSLPLQIQGEVFEVELPTDVSLEECWTLPECGLFEPEAGVRLEELEEDEEVPGRFGDLHVIPIVL